MSVDFKEYQQLEDKFQQKYKDIKLPFTQREVVSVELLGFREVSVGYCDYVDTPDPQFKVSCSVIRRPHLKEFHTRNISDNVTKGFIGQTFKFVIPLDLPTSRKVKINIELRDRDCIRDDIIGNQTIDVSDLVVDEPPTSQTIKFGNNNGELDIILNKSLQKNPDFRYSLGLCPEEIAFRQKRIPIVFEAMKNIFGSAAPRNLQETPVVSVIGSGGGYRAVIGMCGAMSALKDAGLFDMVTYNCGLSGSSWYLAAGYTCESMKADKLDAFHNQLRENFSYNLLWDMVNPVTIKDYQYYLNDTRRKYDQPYTFVNYFPGYLVGKQMLDDKMSRTLTDMKPYVENGEVPYPILVALHVKNRTKSGKYHAYVERTPYEITLPSYGIGIKPQDEGSTWNAGVLVRHYPEYPINFTIGMTGCAFSILLNSYLRNGGELKKNFEKYVEKQRIKGKENANKDLLETNRSAEIESDDDDEDDDEDAAVPGWIVDSNEPEIHDEPISTQNKPDDISTIKKIMLNLSFFKNRNSIVGRTARLYNFALGMTKVEKFLLNPFGLNKSNYTGESKHIIDKFGMEECDANYPIKKNVVSFADAGILKNVPTDVILRPQRKTDLMIVFDFNKYESDDKFDYKPLLSAAAQAWQSGLEFPNIDFKKITNMPPKEFLCFPSTGPNCPTVLWITLCNKKFKQIENFIPRTSPVHPKREKKFNDFSVFGAESAYSTFKFHYDNYEFDQLKELMYHNVTSHIEEIKSAIAEAAMKKRN